jgi:hypothetical protein
MRDMPRVIIAAAMALVLATTSFHASAFAAEPSRLHAAPGALPAISAPAVVASHASCAGTCQSRHDQCRVATKGGPDCDGARQQCLQSCVARRMR